jgi:hypothetical protein
MVAMGDPAVPRAYAWLPDMARAAVALAERRADLPGFADIPFAGLTLSFNDMRAGLERLTGRPVVMGRFGWWQMRLLAPLWELARELLEMRYLYQTPHSLDPAPLAALLPGFRTADPDTVLRSHLPVRADQGRAMSTQTGR